MVEWIAESFEMVRPCVVLRVRGLRPCVACRIVFGTARFEHVPRVDGIDGEFDTVTFIAGTPWRCVRGPKNRPTDAVRVTGDTTTKERGASNG